MAFSAGQPRLEEPGMVPGAKIQPKKQWLYLKNKELPKELILQRNKAFFDVWSKNILVTSQEFLSDKLRTA